jgi:zinc transporter ZupT
MRDRSIPAAAPVGDAAPTADLAPRRAHSFPVTPTLVKGAAPLALLALLVVGLLRFGPWGVLRQSFPPVEQLTIERITLPGPGEMRVQVVNGGPEPVTIAQVFVDEATWTHDIDGDRTLGRLERRTIRVPYPWVAGEPHVVTLVSSSGLTFRAEIPVATQAPALDARYVGTFAMLGVYVGVVPVFLGLLWLPFLRAIGRRWVDFFLSLTVGLLAFLGVEALVEAIETAARLPDALQGIGLVLLGVVGTPLAISLVARRRSPAVSPLTLSALIALAIGLHNLGEGLAIGTAYATGAIALGTFLVLGFLIHNTTEGLGIVAPLAQRRPRLLQLAALGLVAGVPTIIGTWIGGFSYSPFWTTLFFAIGAGAIAQVVLLLWNYFAREPGTGLTAPLNAAGVLLGLVLMYATGLLVTA